MKALKKYYWLAKPGIVYSNTIAAMAGFFLASSERSDLDIGLFFAMAAGIAFVIASACVLNNYIDRNIDRKMKRTSWRATASGKITKEAVIAYTAVLGAVGFGMLAIWTNILTLALAALAYVSYIVFYGIAKRKTIHSTLVGTVPGALPPAIGYVAVTGSLDFTALLLFLIMVCWQMAHFYAIGMYRRDDYAAAGLPVMPVVKGMYATKIQILAYVAAYAVMNVLFAAYGFVGITYLIVMGLLSAAWFATGLRNFQGDDRAWAKRMFVFSFVTLLTFCAMVATGGLLP